MIRLTHTGMRAPHARYRLSDFQELETRCGVAFRAVINDGDHAVGTVENQGTGGETWFHPSSHEAGVAMDQFVAQCRFDGESATDAISVERVLDTLVSEMDLARLTAEAKDSNTVITAFDKYGWTGEAVTCDAPSGAVDRSPKLRARIATECVSQRQGATWRYWTTSGWRALMP